MFKRLKKIFLCKFRDYHHFSYVKGFGYRCEVCGEPITRIRKKHKDAKVM